MGHRHFPGVRPPSLPPSFKIQAGWKRGGAPVPGRGTEELAEEPGQGRLELDRLLLRWRAEGNSPGPQ